jgi:hypothetical protein
MTLRGHVPEAAEADRSLVIVDGRSPEPVRQMLRDLFDGQPVDVAEMDLPKLDGDTVVLVEDSAVVASSPLEDLQEELLLVNSDLFATGTRDVHDVALPGVLEELEGVPFTLRGYPESNTEKSSSSSSPGTSSDEHWRPDFRNA